MAQPYREDMNDLPAYAIDSESTRDVDDAVSLHLQPDGSQWLYVHVSDVTRYITVGSPMDTVRDLFPIPSSHSRPINPCS